MRQAEVTTVPACNASLSRILRTKRFSHIVEPNCQYAIAFLVSSVYQKKRSRYYPHHLQIHYSQPEKLRLIATNSCQSYWAGNNISVAEAQHDSAPTTSRRFPVFHARVPSMERRP